MRYCLAAKSQPFRGATPEWSLVKVRQGRNDPDVSRGRARPWSVAVPATMTSAAARDAQMLPASAKLGVRGVSSGTARRHRTAPQPSIWKLPAVDSARNPEPSEQSLYKETEETLTDEAPKIAASKRESYRISLQDDGHATPLHPIGTGTACYRTHWLAPPALCAVQALDRSLDEEIPSVSSSPIGSRFSEPPLVGASSSTVWAAWRRRCRCNSTRGWTRRWSSSDSSRSCPKRPRRRAYAFASPCCRRSSSATAVRVRIRLRSALPRRIQPFGRRMRLLKSFTP